MTEVAAESVQSPADQDVEPSAFGVADELVEGGASVLPARHAAINIFGGGPASGFDISPQLRKLIFRFLVEPGHTGVDRSPVVG